MDTAQYAKAHRFLKLQKFTPAIQTFIRLLESDDLTADERDACIHNRDDAIMLREVCRHLPPFPMPEIKCDWRIPPLRSGTQNIVFFHVDHGESHPFLTAKDHVDYRAVLKAACAVALRSHPKSAIIVLTNDSTVTPEISAQVVRLPVSAERMMFDRMRAYRALISSRELTGPTMFLDTDVLLNGSLMPLFNEAFDVALTYRDNFWHMPFNEGMILAGSGDSPRALQFFTEALSLYEWLSKNPAVHERYGFNVKAWRGGQLSIAALMNWERPEAGTAIRTIRGVKYKLLPCDPFNYPVSPGDTRETLTSKWALHFKGAAAKSLIPAE